MNTYIDQKQEGLCFEQQVISCPLLRISLCSINRSGTDNKVPKFLSYQIMSSRTKELEILLCAAGLYLYDVIQLLTQPTACGNDHVH